MNKDELQEARSNPEFLTHLEQRRLDALNSEDIVTLYEVMDAMLVLDLDEEKINQTYEEILKISFENIEKVINKNSKVSLEGNDLLYIRSFYEHAIEKWSGDDFAGTNEILFLLLNIVDDQKLIEALKVHLIACERKIDLDSFYENCVDIDMMDKDEKYGYFITHFKFDTNIYIEDNQELLEAKFEQLKHLLG